MRTPIITRKVAALVLASTVLLSSCGRSDEDAASPATSDTVTEQPSEPINGGAMIGNKQRSWPDVTGAFDDSSHVTPGQYSVDRYWQRPVWTPVHHDGDLPDLEQLVDGMDTCADAGGVMLEGTTQQQYVNARFLVVNEKAGPTKMTDGVPGGYAHSPQGAIIAAINQAGYGLPAQGDEIGEALDRELWSTSKEVAEDRKFFNLPRDREGMVYSRPQSVPAMHAYRVVTCSPDVMVVEVLMRELDGLPAPDRQGHAVGRIPLFWREGDWRPDFSGTADAQQARNIFSDEGFTEVIYQ